MTQPSRVPVLEGLLAQLMRGGVLVSALCLMAGLLLWLVASGGDVVLRTGLFVLMATPMLRVAVAAVEAYRDEDWFLVAASLAVTILFAVTLFKSYRIAVGG